MTETTAGNNNKLDLDALMQDALDKTAKEAVEWAVRLPREDFDKVIVLMYKQYKTFVERMQAAIPEATELFQYSKFNELIEATAEEAQAHRSKHFGNYLKGYLTQVLLDLKEELTNV